MYKIGELSRLCRLPVKTLRYYDDIGLLTPDVVDPFTGYRYYTTARLGDCLRILTLKELGFTLEEIRLHLETGDTALLVERKKAELNALIAQTEEKLRRLENLKTMTTEGEHTMYPMVILSGEPLRILCRRRVLSPGKKPRQSWKICMPPYPPLSVASVLWSSTTKPHSGKRTSIWPWG